MKMFNPYLKLGLTIGFHEATDKQSYESISFTNWTPNPPSGRYNSNWKDSYTSEIKWHGGVSYGLNIAGGLDFALSDMLGLFVEANLINLYFKPTAKDASINETTNDYLKNITHTYSGSGSSQVNPNYSYAPLRYIYTDGKVSEVNISLSTPVEEFQFSSFGIRAGVKLKLY